MSRSKALIPFLLIVIGVTIIGWQYVEHRRFAESAREGLINRAQDITNTLAVVIRSQRFFGGVIFQPRLEAALYDLVQPDDLLSIVLFNSNGEIVCSAGPVDEWDLKAFSQTGEIWKSHSVVFMNLVDLGVTPEKDPARTLILPEPDRRDFPPPPPMEGGGWGENPDNPPPGEPEDRLWEGGLPGGGVRLRFHSIIDDLTAGIPSAEIDDASPQKAIVTEVRPGPRDESFRQPPLRRFFGRFRPMRGMSKEEFEGVLKESGLHGFTIELSTDAYYESLRGEIWMRLITSALVSIAIVGFLLAWKNLVKSSELQVRLIRANEMNNHLREMNLAAAGLAHETRNPLNIVRGIAQLIVKNPALETSTRDQAYRITDEVDRVTAQLNEFIHYSKPREPKPVPLRLPAVIQEARQALITDLEDKAIDLQMSIPDVIIEADEALLRQVLFNLLLNSIQAVPERGRISLTAKPENSAKLSLQVRDNGPGIAWEEREKIFAPYFTMRDGGTGLGLAVVKQIVLAHGWEIHLLPGREAGAVFEITGLRLSFKGLADV